MLFTLRIMYRWTTCSPWKCSLGRFATALADVCRTTAPLPFCLHRPDQDHKKIDNNNKVIERPSTKTKSNDKTNKNKSNNNNNTSRFFPVFIARQNWGLFEIIRVLKFQEILKVTPKKTQYFYFLHSEWKVCLLGNAKISCTFIHIIMWLLHCNIIQLCKCGRAQTLGTIRVKSYLFFNFLLFKYFQTTLKGTVQNIQLLGTNHWAWVWLLALEMISNH